MTFLAHDWQDRPTLLNMSHFSLDLWSKTGAVVFSAISSRLGAGFIVEKSCFLV
jgi:hypothetical protein